MDVANFTPPEFFSEHADLSVENLSDSGWQAAINYREKKKHLFKDEEIQRLRRNAVNAIITKARNTIGSIARPRQLETVPWHLNAQGEIALEDSLELDPTLATILTEEKVHRRAEVIVCLDTSLSMTGKKLALLGVSIAVLALQLESEDLSVIPFATEAEVLKTLNTVKSVDIIVEKFLDSQTKGLTNIEDALKKALVQQKRGKHTRRTTILMTDGKFTAGGRPEYLASQFQRLHVVQTGSPWASERFCRNLAKRGSGNFLHINDFEELPKALYNLVHESLR